MKKKNVILACSAMLLLGACQQATKQEDSSSSNSAVMSQSQEQVMEVKSLEKGVWEDKLYARLTKLIEEHGVKSANYDEANKPYVVVDWDNTTIINDIGEATFTYQIMNLAFKMTPEQFEVAIKKDLPLDDFAEDWNNKDGQAVNIDKIAKDLVSDYTVLYNEYSGFKGTKSLEEVQQLDEYKDFRAKLRYLYEAVGDTFSSDISYPWVTYLFTGMTSQEVQDVTEEAIAYSSKDDLVYETWESPATLKGEAGQVSVEFKRGIRTVPEVQDLYATLKANGFDIYVVSASYYDVIYPFATKSMYGYNIDTDKVYAMMLEKDSAGVIQTQLDAKYYQTQGPGKTKTIQDFIAKNYKDADPLLVAGDSNGDYAMMTDFSKMEVGIIFNRLRSTDKGIGSLSKTAVETYDSNSAVYFLQGRDENKGVLLHGRETILLEKTEAKLLKE